MSTDRFQQPASRPHGRDSLAERFQAQHTNPEATPETEQAQPESENMPRTEDTVPRSAPAEQGSGWGNPGASQPSAPPQYGVQQPQPAQVPGFGQQPAAPAPGQQPQPGFPQQPYGQGGYPQHGQQNAQFQQNYQPGQTAQPGAVAMRFGVTAVALSVGVGLFCMAGRLALALADVYERLVYNVLIAVECVAVLTALGFAIAGLMNLQKSNTPQASLWVGLGLGAAGLQLLIILFNTLTSFVL